MLVLFLLIPFIALSSNFNGHSLLTISVERPGAQVGRVVADFEASPARFGIPDYDGDRTGDLVDLKTLEPENNMGCHPISVDLTGKIVLIDRGECFFVNKTQKAQDANAYAVVIISHDESTPIMSPPEDFNHSSVIIPAVLIANSRGEQIRSIVAENPTGARTATINWEIPEKNGQVYFELFTTVNDYESQMFKENFGEIARELVNQGKLDFSVRYFIYDETDMYWLRGEHCREYVHHGQDGSDDPNRPCDFTCANHGRYCSLNPVLALEAGVTGVDDVYEELREMCVWNFTKGYDEHNHLDIWFDYVARFGDRCLITEEDTSLASEKACAKLVIEEVEQQFNLGKDTIWDYVENCVQSSGPLGVDTDEANPVLDWEIDYRKDQAGVWLTPSFTINGYEMRGSWHCPENPSADNCNLFKAICGAFLQGLKPDLCFNDVGCKAGKFKDECGYCVRNMPMTEEKICDPGSRRYPTISPTAFNGEIIIEPGSSMSKKQANAIIMIGLILVLIGATCVGVFYLFKRNSRYQFESRRENEGYLNAVPDLDDGMGFSQNGLVEDGVDGAP